MWKTIRIKEQIFFLCNRFRWQSSMCQALSKFHLWEWMSVCIGPDLLNTFYKRQHVSRFCRLKLGEKWDSPYSDSFAFSRFSLVSEHAAQSAFMLWGFFPPCMSGWGRAGRAALSPEPITDGPIAQQPCFVDRELESCQVNPKSGKKNCWNVDGI